MGVAYRLQAVKRAAADTATGTHSPVAYRTLPVRLCDDEQAWMRLLLPLTNSLWVIRFVP